MEITEIRVKLVEDPSDRLKAYCSITIDGCFVVRDLKVIDGTSGLFVAMPSRKLAARCPQCGCKNHLRARHCNDCGTKLGDGRPARDPDRNKLHADVAHPINTDCRRFIQERVIAEYEAECERSTLPGYVAQSLDMDYDDDVEEEDDASEPSPYAELVKELKSGQRESAEVPDADPQIEPDEVDDEEEAVDVESASIREDRRHTDDGFGAGLL